MKNRNSVLFLCCLCLFAAIPGRAAPVKAVVKSVSGKVECSAPGSNQYKPLSNGQELAMGTTIRTGANGVALVLTVPGAAIRVESKSEIVLNELEFEKAGGKIVKRKAALDLKSGTISALIEKNDPETTNFTIKTPQGVAAARGTFFAVSVDEGKSLIAVKEGKVGLQKTGGEGGKK